MSLASYFAGCFWVQGPRIEAPQSCQESCMKPNPGQHRVEVIDKDWRGTKKHLLYIYILNNTYHVYIYIYKTPGFGPKPRVCIRKYGFPTETFIFSGSWLWRHIVFYIQIKMNQDETLWIQMNSPQSLPMTSERLSKTAKVWTCWSQKCIHPKPCLDSTLQNRKKHGMNPVIQRSSEFIWGLSGTIFTTLQISKLSTATM